MSGTSLAAVISFFDVFLCIIPGTAELDMKMAISTPVKRAPVNSPPKASGPRIRPTAIGARTAISPGRNISFKAALVEIETQEA